jgi:aspartate kinase/aspartokinase/homoserine dehydrogenase 1
MMKKYRVIKLGGSILKTKSDVLSVHEVLKNYEGPLIIVFSAFSGITDKLEKVLRRSDNFYQDGEKVISEITELKDSLINQLIETEELRKTALKDLADRIEKLKLALFAVQCIGKVPDFLRAEILSYGEKLCTITLKHILNYLGFSCIELLPEEIPILTDDQYNNASIDLNQSAHAIQGYLNGTNYIIPGYYGISEKRDITLLGRGGSDYSAACIAQCADALSLDLWKNVDGFLSADPQIVSQVRIINSLTYDEASEMAYFGAEILHPRTVEPIREKTIKINLYNINDYTGWPEPKSIINGERSIAEDIVKGITFSDDFGIVKIKGAGVGIRPGVLARITMLLEEHNINIKSVLTSQIAINLLVGKDVLTEVDAILKEGDIHGIEDISVVDDISVVSAVGEGLIHHHGLASKIFSAVAQESVNMEMICFGASSVAVYFVVKREETLRAIHALHHTLFHDQNENLKSENKYEKTTT